MIATVNTGTNPNRVVLSHDGKWIYLTNYGGSSVSVIDASTNAVVATIPVGGLPDGLALTPDDSLVLVGSALGGVTVINTASRTVTGTIKLQFAGRVAVAPDGKHAYVSQPNVSQLAVIDMATSTLRTTIPFGWIPLGLAFGQDGGRLYVTDRGNNTVSAFDPAANRIVGTLTVGTAPVDVTVGTIATGP